MPCHVGIIAACTSHTDILLTRSCGWLGSHVDSPRLVPGFKRAAPACMTMAHVTAQSVTLCVDCVRNPPTELTLHIIIQSQAKTDRSHRQSVLSSAKTKSEQQRLICVPLPAEHDKRLFIQVQGVHQHTHHTSAREPTSASVTRGSARRESSRRVCGLQRRALGSCLRSARSAAGLSPRARTSLAAT